MVDVAHDGDDRRSDRIGGEHLFVDVFVEFDVEQLEQLDFLLFTGIDEADLGTDVFGERLDHLVVERLGTGDHLTVHQQESHDVGRRTVQLRTEVLCGRCPLDDDDAFWHHGI